MKKKKSLKKPIRTVHSHIFKEWVHLRKGAGCVFQGNFEFEDTIKGVKNK